MGSLETAAVVINCVSAFALTGIIWLVQLVHYPYFEFTDRTRSAEAHAMHKRRITPIVAPLMLLELFSASALVLLLPESTPALSVYMGIFLVAVIWVSTFMVQVPLHRQLSGGSEARAVRRLVRSNWIRTAAWSARSVLALHILWSVAGSRL